MARLRVIVDDPDALVRGTLYFSGPAALSQANNFVRQRNAIAPATANVEVALLAGAGKRTKIMWVSLEDVLEVASEYKDDQMVA